MIEVGDYVRIDKDHRIIALGIAKVVKTINETIYVKNNFELPITIDKNSISKHSKNIIDLIEVGDIVEIFDVLNEDVIYIWNEEMLKALKEDIKNGIGIRRILTHEQFEANCYKVKEE